MSTPDPVTESTPTRGSALVLGGGGVTGIAWMLGLLHGLQQAGVDLTDADLVVGTSAGSVVGAQITSGHTPSDLYAGQLRPAHREIGASFGSWQMLRLLPPLLMPGTGRMKRRRIGAMSVRAHPTGDRSRIDVIESRIDVKQWPDRDLRVTAVDATTGALKVFDRHGDAPIVEAVAASCAVPLVWPAIEIGGRPYIDGGVRSTANADLAQGSERVVVLAPLPRSLSKRTAISAQLSRTGAQHTTVVSPDRHALEAIGKNVLDPAKRAGAAEAGLRQAADVADQVREVWKA